MTPAVLRVLGGTKTFEASAQPVGAALKPVAAAAATATGAVMPGSVPTPGMTPPGGSTSKPVLRSRFLRGGGDSDLSRSFLLLCRSLLRDLLRLSRLSCNTTAYFRVRDQSLI